MLSKKLKKFIWYFIVYILFHQSAEEKNDLVYREWKNVANTVLDKQIKNSEKNFFLPAMKTFSTLQITFYEKLFQ